jgi:lipopolysaccharide/colanic/teichoic acid biosynthesis glycosyltransferase
MRMMDYEIAATADFGAGIAAEPAVAHHPHDLEGARRFLNVAVAALGLIITAPLMALIAVAVKLTSPGPVFYRQTRVGLCHPSATGNNDRRCAESGGQLFTIYKFRTMQAVAPSAESQVWCGAHDPRITTVGHFLRRSRLDELPQLLNVLMGDMNVVGPRPEQPKIFASLRAEVPGYMLRQRVRPGITGLAQITLAYDTCIDDVRKKVSADLQYIANQSLLTDLGIMLRTVPVMMMRIGSR